MNSSAPPLRWRAERRCRFAVVLAVAGLALVSETGTAMAQSASTGQPPDSQLQGENGEMSQHMPGPLVGTLTYNSDLNADIDGGTARGSAYLQRVGLIGDVDLDRLVGWRGATAHVSVHLINGTGLSTERVGTILSVSGLEAEPAVRLFNLWIEQKLGSGASLRVGQFTAGQEFAISPTAALFVNSTFGWPASFAVDLPSGGPAYPLAAPGLRLAATPVKRVTLRAALFAGDPAGPGTADPQRRDLHGFNGFRFRGGPFVIGEVATSAPGDDPVWTLAIGGWAHADRFDDLNRDAAGNSLASPASSGVPLRHRGNAAIYAIADARLWQSGGRTLRGFIRFSASPADRNIIDRYLDTGLTLSAPLRGRSGDTVGIAFGFAHISPALRSLLIERNGTTPSETPRYEGVLEADWQIRVGKRLSLQPNMQLILHPAAALLAGSASRSAAKATVIGLRTSFRL